MALCVSESESATATSARMTSSFRAATAMRVWQRQSMEWIAAVFAADPTAMPRSMSRRLQCGELEFVGVFAELVGGVEELGAGGVSAGAAVVVRWVPVGEADEECCVDGFGGFGVAEPDGFAAFLAAGAHPLRETVEGVAVVDDDGFDEQVLALQEELDLGAVMAAAAMSLATWRTVSARSVS